MDNSAIFQGILQAERWKGHVAGRLEEARRILLMIGRKRLGRPGKAVVAAIEAIVEVERLEALVVESVHAESWQQVFAAGHRWQCEVALRLAGILPSQPTEEWATPRRGIRLG